jgi:D-3-phosphoglycerate dehydrogenase
MKALFIDCDPAMAALWRRVRRSDDPPIELNTAPPDPDGLPALLRGCAICLDDHSYFPAAVLERCTDLRHIVFLGTGAASYVDLAAAARLGIEVATIRNFGDLAVAEHTLALMLAAAREVARMDRQIRAGTWQVAEGLQLAGKTLGVLGLGGIGREVARLGRALGMDVIAWNRSPVADPPAPLAVLDEVLARADVLSLHLALDDATRGFLDAARLARTRPGVILVNTARGALVEETALLDALRSGHIRHAALDVFHGEPLAASHPLASLPNVTLTAHAGFNTPEATMTLLRRAIDIVRDILARAA